MSQDQRARTPLPILTDTTVGDAATEQIVVPNVDSVLERPSEEESEEQRLARLEERRQRMVDRMKKAIECANPTVGGFGDRMLASMTYHGIKTADLSDPTTRANVEHDLDLLEGWETCECGRITPRACYPVDDEGRRISRG